MLSRWRFRIRDGHSGPGQGPSGRSFYLRRRRYGASHGVGLHHRLPGLEGTYAVATTAPAAYLQRSLDATPLFAGVLLCRVRADLELLCVDAVWTPGPSLTVAATQ